MTLRQNILDTLGRHSSLSATAIAACVGVSDMPTVYAELASMEASQLVAIESRHWTLRTLRHSAALAFGPECRPRRPVQLVACPRVPSPPEVAPVLLMVMGEWREICANRGDEC